MFGDLVNEHYQIQGFPQLFINSEYFGNHETLISLADSNSIYSKIPISKNKFIIENQQDLIKIFDFNSTNTLFVLKLSSGKEITDLFKAKLKDKKYSELKEISIDNELVIKMCDKLNYDIKAEGVLLINNGFIV